MKMILNRKGLLFLLILALLLSSVTGNGKGDAKAEEGVHQISLMTNYYDEDPMPADSPVLKALQDYTNTEIDFTWIPANVYNDKFNITLASGDIPNIVFAPGITPSVINAARSGVFWELGASLKNYPNLSQANKVVLNNASIDGKTYGIYRRRTLGRYGVLYREDWLKNVGLNRVETIDDFYNMLYRFTYNDPDGNGKDDTYGMVCVQYNGPWKISLTWFNAPNEWGEDGKGNLVPAHLTKEYMDALKFWKKLYDEGLINKDFAVFDNGKWFDPILAEKAGVIVDVCDGAARWEQKFIGAGIDAQIGIAGSIKGPAGIKNLPTSGYSGMYTISKTSVKTDKDLDIMLTFEDKLSDVAMQDLLSWGIEGRHYNMLNGEIDPIEGLTELKPELYGANQLLSFIPNIGTPRTRTAVRVKQDEIMEANEADVVGNPALPLMSSSKVYAQKGPQLDQMIEDARVQFIAGQIDEAGFDAAVTLWKKSGGDDLIAEINTLYSNL